MVLMCSVPVGQVSI